MNNKLLKYLDYLKKHLYNELTNNKKDCYIIGISCGIDSVLSLRILLDVFEPTKIKPYFIDIESVQDKHYLNVIINYFKKFNLEINEVNFLNTFNCIKGAFEINNQTNLGNIKSKLRSMYLYAKAFEKNGLVLNTTNYDEFILGYFTKFGDSNGDVFLLNGLLKSNIYELANYYELPNEIINRKPTSGLLNDNHDELEFGFSYQELDDFLLFKLKDKNKIELIKNRIIKNQHKQKILKNTLLKPYKKYKY